MCLRRARKLAPHSSPTNLYSVAQGVMDMLRGYLDTLTTSSTKKPSVELVRLSIEAVLGLRLFTAKIGGANCFSTSANLHFQDRLDGSLIDAVATMLLDDPGAPPVLQWQDRTVKADLIRTLLWVWKNTADMPMNGQEKERIFDSSCRLWEPLKEEVDFSKAGEYEFWIKPLTSDDLNRIVEFIKFIRKDRENSAFISRNADVGINCLYVHFNERIEWEYDLFGTCKQPMLCSRMTHLENGLL